MTDKNKSKRIDEATVKRMIHAIEEYYKTGKATVKCDECGDIITFQVINKERNCYKTSCSCGKYNDTQRGI